ncbi:MAG: hypothetical protein ABSG19_09945 [Candidatus Aminicenantales bacterium]
MLESHLALMLIFAAVVSVMTAFLKFETKKEIVRHAARTFAVLVGGGILLSWLLYFV